jgi:putative transposase
MKEKSINLRRDDAFFHAFNRGVDRQQIFFAPADYLFFIELMQKFHDASSLLLLAFTLMPNHFHLIVHQQSPYAISNFVKQVCERYVKHLNRYRKRVGHLFQSPYIPKLIDNESYLLYLSRYVHLNPVSGGLVKSPEDWPYGSCRVYQEGMPNGFVDSHIILDIAGGQDAYLKYIHAPLVECNAGLERYLIDREFL